MKLGKSKCQDIKNILRPTNPVKTLTMEIHYTVDDHIVTLIKAPLWEKVDSIYWDSIRRSPTLNYYTR